ncbi:hypothetical protein GUI43_03290 [Micromonospora noduli]|uniref:Uncharacterized protein n=1 Tax=Micromonospora noduli TaxID=709876 RepID=A0A328NF59_9ACTN|nr:hypothetical protein LAH08_00898 [Micromonospora noduli]RAO11027.1 hypothetical protein GUI43_03290 [Micromonospora noduli]RAO22748.1 hypothetical protein MED15_01598 [Micromonospora noduli]RAO23210.1 hypothetical protein LUPAC07_00374 [Micromonospora noduli]RAO28468.1 hypothetical protein ONO86_06005 [Micromonospora noduli]
MTQRYTAHRDIRQHGPSLGQVGMPTLWRGISVG